MKKVLFFTLIIIVYPKRNQIVLHCGAVHVSKDTIEWNGQQIFGLISSNFKLNLKNNDNDDAEEKSDNNSNQLNIIDESSVLQGEWGTFDENCVLTSVSQEHGTVTAPSSWIEERRVGEVVAVFVVHSCLVMANFRDEFVEFN